MVEKQLNKLTAIKLRAILLVTIFIIFILGGAIFWFLRGQLVVLAEEVREANSQATTTSNDIIRLQGLKKVLDEDQVAVKRAENIVAHKADYAYQDKIIDDLTAYSKKTRINILGINFNSATAGAAAPVSKVAGTDKVSVTVTLASPVAYRDIMQFVRLVEYNLPKMKIKGVNMINTTPGSGKLQLNVPTIDLEVYVR